MMRHFREFGAMSFAFMGYNETMARLGAGNLLGKIKNDMQKAIDKEEADKVAAKEETDKTVDKVKEEEAMKLYLYSGHDDGIVTFLQALKVFQPHIPNYSCAVVLELFEDKNKPVGL